MREATKTSGIIVSEFDDGTIEVRVLRKCVHCGYRWEVDPASPKKHKRGFCCNCMGYCCGRPSCVATGCIPEERYLDNLSNGRPADYKPIIASVPGLPGLTG